MHPWQASAATIARKIREREWTCGDVLEAHLARIAEVNGSVNALVKVLANDARQAAADADGAVRDGAPLGLLHGVPFTAKENVDVAGLPTTWGAPGLRDAVASRDAPVVERMKAAGAILVGRTNLPDMGLRMYTESSVYGITRNPWNAARTAGGSSGGEAAALATGMTALGLGNDLGGSLRNPASACGIASIRPSAGRVPHAAQVPAEDRLPFVQLMAVEGPLARTVGDVRLALQALMGAHPRDPWTISAPLEGPPVDRPLRVAVLGEPPGGTCQPAVQAIVRHAADALAHAGYEVVEATPPHYEETLHLWSDILWTDLRFLWPHMAPALGETARTLLKPFVEDADRARRMLPLSALLARRDAIARAWSTFMAAHPLLLTPTWTAITPPHGYDIDEPAEAMKVARPVLPANLLGLPSACAPAGIDAGTGLPVGVLLTGARFREDLCLDAAEVVERAAGVVTPIAPRG